MITWLDIIFVLKMKHIALQSLNWYDIDSLKLNTSLHNDD